MSFILIQRSEKSVVIVRPQVSALHRECILSAYDWPLTTMPSRRLTVGIDVMRFLTFSLSSLFSLSIRSMDIVHSFCFCSLPIMAWSSWARTSRSFFRPSTSPSSSVIVSRCRSTSLLRMLCSRWSWSRILSLSDRVLLRTCWEEHNVEGTVRAPVFGRHQFFNTSVHFGKAHGSLLSGWMNYNYTACCWFPTSSNSLILPSQFWQISFESYWLHCSKCRILDSALTVCLQYYTQTGWQNILLFGGKLNWNLWNIVSISNAHTPFYTLSEALISHRAIHLIY